MNQIEKNTKNFSLFIEFQIPENRPSQKTKRLFKKIGKANRKLQSQNYGFASDQNGNEALKLATSFNDLKKGYAN